MAQYSQHLRNRLRKNFYKRRMDVKRFLSILLAAVMVLLTFATTMVEAAATTETILTYKSDTSDGTTNTLAKEIYLSDITPTSWKMLDGFTPGYNVYYEDGTSLLLAGVTYDKGLSTHPGGGFDAEFVYDISDYDYTTFSAIVGKTDRYVAALPGSFTSFHVYVDGVLADEIINLVAGQTYTFNVNVAGASELKLVTGGGSDNITCDGSIWANAKLSYDKIDPVDPPAVSGKALYLSDISPKSATALSGPFYNKNEQGEPLLLDGFTYKKGFWTHPMPNKEAESIYDISKYDYTIFYAVVGKEQKYVNALPGSLLTFRVYVDGVLADEVVDLVAGETYIFKVNIAGASELKLTTGVGSDDLTCDGSVWADAKLTMDKDSCEEHIWDEGRIIKDPTCAEVGKMKYQCMSCIGDKIDDIPVFPHTKGSWGIGEQASCTEAGTKVQKCSECGEIVDSTVWDAKGHIPGIWLTTKSATCTEAGKMTQTCQNCGAVLAEEEIPAAGHFFGDWGFIDGQKVRVCECGEQDLGGGCASLLSVDAVTMMLLTAGTVTFLLNKKKRQGK